MSAFGEQPTLNDAVKIYQEAAAKARQSAMDEAKAAAELDPEEGESALRAIKAENKRIKDLVTPIFRDQQGLRTDRGSHGGMGGSGSGSGGGKSWNGKREEEVQKRKFDPSQGVNADSNLLPWVKLGVKHDEWAEKAIAKLDTEGKDPKKAAEQNALLRSLVSGFRNGDVFSGTEESKKGLALMLSEPNAAALARMTYGPHSQTYEWIGRVLKGRIRDSLIKDISDFLASFQGNHSPEGIKKTVAEQNAVLKDFKAKMQPKFERLMLVESFGVDGLTIPIPSDPTWEKSMDNLDAFKTEIQNPLKQASDVFVENEVRNLRTQAARELTRTETPFGQQPPSNPIGGVGGGFGGHSGGFGMGMGFGSGMPGSTMGFGH